jgi:hypothetical protein
MTWGRRSTFVRIIKTGAFRISAIFLLWICGNGAEGSMRLHVGPGLSTSYELSQLLSHHFISFVDRFLDAGHRGTGGIEHFARDRKCRTPVVKAEFPAFKLMNLPKEELIPFLLFEMLKFFSNRTQLPRRFTTASASPCSWIPSGRSRWPCCRTCGPYGFLNQGCPT